MFQPKGHCVKNATVRNHVSRIVAVSKSAADSLCPHKSCSWVHIAAVWPLAWHLVAMHTRICNQGGLLSCAGTPLLRSYSSKGRNESVWYNGLEARCCWPRTLSP